MRQSVYGYSCSLTVECNIRYIIGRGLGPRCLAAPDSCTLAPVGGALRWGSKPSVDLGGPIRSHISLVYARALLRTAELSALFLPGITLFL